MDIDSSSLLAELVDAVHFLDGFINRDKCRQVAETIRVHLGWLKLKSSGKESVKLLSTRCGTAPSKELTVEDASMTVVCRGPPLPLIFFLRKHSPTDDRSS